MGRLHFHGIATGLAILLVVLLGVAPGLAADPRLLASSCSGCHAGSQTPSTVVPRIQGLPEAVIASALRAFRTGERPGTVMGRIAKGFTEDEIKELAAYFSASI